MIGGIIIILLLITGCGDKQKINDISSYDNNNTSQENTNQMSIVGTYVGESQRKWLLNIYGDGTLQLDDKYGTYDKVGDIYILTIDKYAFKLNAEITDNGNLYITSDHPNWDAEMYERYKPDNMENEKIELADAVGENWSDFCEKTDIEKYEQFKIREKYDDGTYDLVGDLGTELEVLGDGSLFCIGIGDYESSYTICGAYIRQDYYEAENSIAKYGMECVQERVYYEEGEKYNSYSLWRCEQFDLNIFERGGQVAMLFAAWNN